MYEYKRSLPQDIVEKIQATTNMAMTQDAKFIATEARRHREVETSSPFSISLCLRASVGILAENIFDFITEAASGVILFFFYSSELFEQAFLLAG